MRKAFWILPVFVIAALILLSIRQRVVTGNSELHVSGTIEVTEVRASFRIPGLIKKLLVNEGDLVVQEQLIAYLESDELERQISLRQADKTIAESALKELQAGSLPEEIAQVRAKRDQANADFQRLKTDFNRQQQLFNQKVISKREFDASQTSYEVAKARLQEAEKALTLMEGGIREEKIEQANARLQQAVESLALADTHLTYATLSAPISGFILSKNVEAGEYVMAGTPIVAIGNLNDMWLRAYINETDLGHIKLGQKVKISTDIRPNTIYEGVISFISPEAEFTPKNIQTAEERVKLVFRIKVTIQNPNHELKPGMPADGLIVLGL